jgi:hypothetical protein
MLPRLFRVLPWLLTSCVHAGEPVRVEIFEGPIKAKTWDLMQVKETSRCEEPAFALVHLPAKYSPRGIALDRSRPYLVRATQTVTLPPGEYQFLMRSRWATRLSLDDNLFLELDFPKVSINGHESVQEIPYEPGLRSALPGQREVRKPVKLDGKPHVFRWEMLIGGQELRPEVGEPVVAVATGGKPFQLLGDSVRVPFTDEGWERFARERGDAQRRREAQARLDATTDERAYWQKRHAEARRWCDDQPAVAIPETTLPVHNPIDRFLGARLEKAGAKLPSLLDDDAFLRRVTLDTAGVLPSPAEIAAFRQDQRPDRRTRVIDRLLADARWADHWVSYWQDVLAENPGLLKPTLNNTGPFRWWLHEALLDNLPLDRFATELTLMEGSLLAGAPSGFAVATENDVPMAAKAQTLARAFLAADLTCARCHDAPSKSYRQEQLFGMAALLERKPLVVPVTSTVKHGEGGRIPAVKSTLKAGTQVAPGWQLDDLAASKSALPWLRNADDPRERVAAILTAPENERFAQVLANRVWKRYFGVGLVEPADDWRRALPSHPELLTWLGRELTRNGYDTKHVARLILSSHAYQRMVIPPVKEHAGLFVSPARRRMTAEQLVDSLFALAGKEFGCEELNLDPECRMEIKQATNLGVPTRSWHFASLANERDRPALALPLAQGFLDVLTAYGWRDSRPSSQTVRDEMPTPSQALVLGNGLLHKRIARLSDDSAFTALCLEDVTLPELIQRTYERVLTRRPTPAEATLFEDLLREGFSQRRTGKPALPRVVRRVAVSWANHLSPEATRMKLELEQRARAGDPPTPRLEAKWRERMEDMLWTLMSSPEYVFVP